MFQDITTLLLNPKAFKYTIDIFVDRYRDMDISVIAGVEARGFLFVPAIALAIGAKFVPLRKPKKLPGQVIFEEYELDYGFDCLEMHVGSVQPGDRAVIIDDLVATGGTLSAAIRLLERPENDLDRAQLMGQHFQQEVKMLATLKHPNIVRFIGGCRKHMVWCIVSLVYVSASTCFFR